MDKIPFLRFKYRKGPKHYISVGGEALVLLIPDMGTLQKKTGIILCIL